MTALSEQCPCLTSYLLLQTRHLLFWQPYEPENGSQSPVLSDAQVRTPICAVGVAQPLQASSRSPGRLVLTLYIDLRTVPTSGTLDHLRQRWSNGRETVVRYLH